MKPLSSKSIEHGIGWSRKAWAYPLTQFIEANSLYYNTALEIGASEHSSLMSFLENISKEITISYFDCDVTKLKMRITRVLTKKQPAIIQKSIIDLHGSYDVIIAKSVLGGIFRKDNSTLKDVDYLIQKLIRENINPGGYLLLLDNGQSFFETLLSRVGARKNQWRYFSPNDFQNYTQQYTFGTLSAFSLGSRYGTIGHIFDNFLYYIDLFLNKFNKGSTVILTAYKNE